MAVWDVASGERVSEFDTVLDCGGRRLAITSDGTRVIAGAYHRYGIACYCASTGALLWQRKDIKKVQMISISADDSLAYCCLESTLAVALKVSTGETAGFEEGVQSVFVSPFRRALLLEMWAEYAELRGVGRIRCSKILKGTFSLTDAAFSRNHALAAEAGGPLRCFHMSDAVEAWRFDCPTNMVRDRTGVHHIPSPTHAIHVDFDEGSRVFQAVIWPYQHGGEYVLARLDEKSGTLLSETRIPNAFECGFCLRGSRLLTTGGALIDTRSGKVDRTLGSNHA